MDHVVAVTAVDLVCEPGAEHLVVPAARPNHVPADVAAEEPSGVELFTERSTDQSVLPGAPTHLDRLARRTGIVESSGRGVAVGTTHSCEADQVIPAAADDANGLWLIAAQVARDALPEEELTVDRLIAAGAAQHDRLGSVVSLDAEDIEPGAPTAVV